MTESQNSKFKSQKSFTLVEVLVAVGLIALIFLGIFTVYTFGLRVVSLSQNRITAIAIANQQIEQIRNLSYQAVGVQGKYPSGDLPEIQTITRNNISYTVKIRIDYVVDPADGIALPDDSCPNDYKRVRVEVSWQGQHPGQIKLVSDIVPKNIAEECATTGGILSVSVFDASGVMVNSPSIEIKNPTTGELITTATPADGKHYFSLPAGTYRVVVSKAGYSQDRTYSSDEVTTPEKSDPPVLEGQLTENSFSIDRLSSFNVSTFSLWGQGSFSDSFLDETKIAQKSNIILTTGESILETTSPSPQEGYLISIDVAPSNLTEWSEFSFSDSEPSGTQIYYQILYQDGENWILIPEADLPGNSAGFNTSPVDLSGLNITTYPKLRLKGNFSTTVEDQTPRLFDWSVSWKTSQPTSIPNLSFNLKGAKIIGKNSQEQPVYKYSQTHNSGASGSIVLGSLEWDSYTFSLPAGSNLDLVNTNPSPQPIALAPAQFLLVYLFFQAQNSLLVTVKDINTAQPVFSAQVRVYNTSLGYDVTQNTNEEGQTLFIPLENATYTIEVQAAGYSSGSGTSSVSGDTLKTINLTQIE